MANKLTPIEKYLRTLPMERVEAIHKAAKANKMVFDSRCRCLLGVAGGGTVEGYWQERLNQTARNAEYQLSEMGEGFTDAERDRARNKAIIPYLSAEIARRKKSTHK